MTKCGVPILLILLFIILGSGSASASQAKKSGDFTYRVEDGEVYIIKYTGKASKVIIPDKIKKKKVVGLDEEAISNLKNLKHLVIGRYVRTIERAYQNEQGELFVNCKKLSKVTVKAKNKNYYSIDGVLIEKVKTKSKKKTVTTKTLVYYPQAKKGAYTVPKDIKVISNSAFYSCNNLTKVKMLKSVTKIVGNPFIGCINLQQIIVSKTNKKYKSIKGGLYNKKGTVLYCCPNKKSVNYKFPKSVIKIGGGAFAENTKLTSLTIPKRIKSVGLGIVTDCTNLKEIVVENKMYIIGQFEGCPNLEKLVIKNKKTNFYIAHDKLDESSWDDCPGCAMEIFYKEDILMPKKVTLYAQAGSIAETKKFNIPFQEIK